MHTINTIAGTITFDGPPVMAGSPLDWPSTLGQWINNLPTHLVSLWHTAGALWWPWAPLLVLAVAAGTIAVRLALAALWRRVASGGYWVQVTPPRTVDAARWGLVWRRLEGLAWRARGGRWHLIKPPLAFEVYADRRGLRAGLCRTWSRCPSMSAVVVGCLSNARSGRPAATEAQWPRQLRCRNPGHRSLRAVQRLHHDDRPPVDLIYKLRNFRTLACSPP